MLRNYNVVIIVSFAYGLLTAIRIMHHVVVMASH